MQKIVSYIRKSNWATFILLFYNVTERRIELLSYCYFAMWKLSSTKVFSCVSFPEHLALDKTLTRQEITTLLGHPVNLGCYVTKANSSQTPSTPAPASLTYRWVKGNFSVTQSPRSRIHGNVLVVTPKSDEDFGKYECNVTNGVSSTRCSILLIQGWRDNGDNSTSKWSFNNPFILFF